MSVRVLLQSSIAVLLTAFGLGCAGQADPDDALETLGVGGFGGSLAAPIGGSHPAAAGAPGSGSQLPGASMGGSGAVSNPGSSGGAAGSSAGAGMDGVAGMAGLAGAGSLGDQDEAGSGGSDPIAGRGGAGGAGGSGASGSAGATSVAGSGAVDDPFGALAGSPAPAGTPDPNGPCKDLMLFCFDPFDMFILNPECFTCNNGAGCQACNLFQAE